MDNYGYDAPDFFDFSRDLEVENTKDVDAYFEVEHECRNDVPANLIFVEDGEKEMDQEFFTPLKLPYEPEHAQKCLENNLRRSLSTGNLPTVSLATNNVTHLKDVNALNNDLKKISISKPFKQRSNSASRKSHNMVTRANSPKLHLRSRSISKAGSVSSVTSLNQNKKFASTEQLQPQKFVSMAESIRQFQAKTPQRFRSKSKTDISSLERIQAPILFNTIPQSPALRTKMRGRPISADAISRDEKEIQDFEEAKKSRVKPLPLNSKILKAPLEMPIIKKPLTKVMPFKLTEPIKKKIVEPPPIQFHAKPVPKSIKEPPKPILKSLISSTQPVTPDLLKRYPSKESIELKPSKVVPCAPKIGPTKILPFSFADRDKEIKKKKEQLINQVMEEEKKAREFHAKPIPKCIFKSPQTKQNLCTQSRIQKSNSDLQKALEKTTDVTFKARPANVLKMKPFEPKKSQRPLAEIFDFQLNTERRATVREEFDEQIKEKQKMIDETIKQRELETIQREQDDKARLRKEAEYKANPIRHYKEVVPVASKKLTEPMSPSFVSRKNKENSN